MPDVAETLTVRATEKAQAIAQNVTQEIIAKQIDSKTGLTLPTNGLKDGLVQSLKGAREEITGGVNTKLSNPLFTTGAKDQLSSIDVYGQKNNNIINTFVDTLKGILTGSLESFREQGLGGILGNITSFQNVISQAANGFNLNPAAMADRILGCIGSSSALNSVSDALKTACTLGGQISPQLASTVYTVIENVVTTSFTPNVKDAQSLYSLVDQVTNDSRLSGVIDFGAQCSIFTGMMGSAIDLNMPGAISTLVEKSKHDDVAKIALQANAVNAVVSGNLTVVNLFLDELGAGKMMRDIPNAVPTLTQNYQSPTVIPESELPAKWTEFNTTLEKFDPNWTTVERDGENVSNLAAVTNASPDAKRLMAQDPTLATALLIAGKYPPVDLRKNLKSKYPLAAVA